MTDPLQPIAKAQMLIRRPATEVFEALVLNIVLDHGPDHLREDWKN